MKVIGSKKQNEALARLGALYVMAQHAVIKGVKDENVLEYMDKLIDNAAELANIIGGIGGMKVVKEMIESKLW